MYVCKNCGTSHPTPMNFCNRCGSAVVAVDGTPRASGTPAYSQPPVNPYSGFGIPTSPVRPASGGSIGLAITGMILGILSAASSLITFILSCAAIDEANSYYQDEDFIIIVFIFALFTVIQSVAGMILSIIAKKNGNTSGIMKTGLILGIVSTAINGLSLFLSFIALVMM